MNFHLIEHDADFLDCCLEASQYEAIAMDTEFVRESTYFPRFCLLQIGLPKTIFLIDPLQIDSLEPLQKLLTDTNPCAILHSARQDLEVFQQEVDRLPRTLKDTQIAAALSGSQDQAGYATLAQEILGVTVNKEQTRTDWSNRPLTHDQLHYAATDVHHLLEITDHLETKLHQLGRYEWWTEDSERLLDPALYTTELENSWKRVKGIFELDPASGARAIEIATWREEAAIALNLPRGWVMRDETLTYCARLKDLPPQVIRFRNTPQTLQNSWVLNLKERHRAKACELQIETFLKSRPSRPGPERLATLKAMAEHVQSCAKELAIAPSILAGKKDLELFLDGHPGSRLQTGWRKAAIGEALLRFLPESAPSL